MPSFTDSISTGAGCTWSPCNNCRTTPPPFYTSSFTSPAAASEVNPVACMIQFGSAAKNFVAPRLNPLHQLLTSRPAA